MQPFPHQLWMQCSIFRKRHVSWRIANCHPWFCKFGFDCVVVILRWTRSNFLASLLKLPVVFRKFEMARISQHGMNDGLLIFHIVSDTWAFFQIIRLFHTRVTNSLVRWIIVIKACFTLRQIVTFVSNWIFNMVVVSIRSGTCTLQFLFELREIVLLAIPDANLFGPASFVSRVFISVLNWYLFVNFLKWTWDVESFVVSNAKLEVCESSIIFLICVFWAWWRAESLEIDVAFGAPGKFRLVTNRKIWSRLLMW